MTVCGSTPHSTFRVASAPEGRQEISPGQVRRSGRSPGFEGTTPWRPRGAQRKGTSGASRFAASASQNPFLHSRTRFRDLSSGHAAHRLRRRGDDPRRSGSRRNDLCPFSSRKGTSPRLKLLQFHPAARREMTAAHAWYARQSLVAADGFYNELLPALDRAQKQPRLYPTHIHNTQRLVLHRYPFSIIYRDF